MADFNITISIPDEKINDFKQMIDDRLSNEYGKQRITPEVLNDDGEVITEEVVIGYVKWIEVLLYEFLKANYKGWKRDKIKEENKQALEDDLETTFTN